MLYSIISQLQETASTNDKLEIMKTNKDNELFKEYMRLVTCPSVSFYITEKTLPIIEKCNAHQAAFDKLDLRHCELEFAKRNVTGNDAKLAMRRWMEDQATMEDVELCRMLLLKDIRAKIGVTLVNKVWPNLCVDVPYQRCSLPDEKTLKKFNNGETFIVQTKCDGSFATLVMENEGCSVSLYTRNGNSYPKHVVEHLLQGSYNWEGSRKGANHALEGELLCLHDGQMLSRKQGNGLLNSLMQGAEIPQGVALKYILWNHLPIKDWKSGKTVREYGNCFTALYAELEMCLNPEHFEIVDHWYVDSLQEAYKFNQEQLAKGLEGSIIKTLSHKWKNSTSKECLKLKIKAEIDLVVVDIEEASGKDAGCAGRIIAQSSCGKLLTGVNCNGEQQDRRHIFENKGEYIGKVFTCIANDLVDNELKPNVMALFLARSDLFNEIRNDKDEADSLERIEHIFKAIKNGEMLYKYT